MSITVEELRNMNPDTYQLIDIRSESEIAHGAIPGATAIPGEEISSSEQTDTVHFRWTEGRRTLHRIIAMDFRLYDDR